MKKIYGRIKNIMFFMTIFLMTSVLGFAEEAKDAVNTSGTLYSALGAIGGGGSGSGGSSGSGSSGSGSSGVVEKMITKFKPAIDFLLKFRGIIIVVFALIVGVVIIVSIIKQIANPDLTQIIITSVTIILAVLLVFGFYALIDDVAGTELPINMVRSGIGITTGL